MIFEAVVVGGSFAGLSAAMQLARARRSVCVVDSGSPRNRFAAVSHGFFGQDGTSPQEMIAKAREKLLVYPTVTFHSDQVNEAERETSNFRITLASGSSLLAKKLILAFGLKDEMPPIPGLSERWGHSVLHCGYCHGYEFGGKHLGVLNVAALSLHQAMLIPDWGPTTFFLNGQPSLDGGTMAQLAQRGVVIEETPIAAVEGQERDLSGVRLINGQLVPLAALFLVPRTVFQSPLAEQLGCELKDGPLGKIIVTDETKLTTIPGVYAAGDIARAPHNATFASADGVAAGMSVHKALVF